MGGALLGEFAPWEKPSWTAESLHEHGRLKNQTESHCVVIHVDFFFPADGRNTIF